MDTPEINIAGSVYKQYTWIVIPAYNESEMISEVVLNIKNLGWSKILVVDDGSTDRTSENARGAGALIVKHVVNRGKGASLRTGFEVATRMNAEIIVTIDADGQHNPREIDPLAKKVIYEKYDVVLGTRSINFGKMPLDKIIANFLANTLTYLLFGLWVNDSQSGFRAYSRKAVDLITTRFDQYEYESEVIGQIKKHHLRFIEVPIETSYTKYSTGKKNRQTFIKGIKTAFKLSFLN